MPKREDQNDNLLDKILGGRDAKGRFIPKAVVQAVRDLNDESAKYRKTSEATAKQVSKLTKALLKSNKATLAATKGTLSSVKRENELIKSKSRLIAKTSQLTLRLRRQRDAMDKAEKAGRRFGLSLRTIGLAGAGFAAFRRFQDSINRQLDAAVVGGPDILKRIGPLPSGSIAPDKLLEPLGKILSESQSLRFGASDSQLQGIVKAINETRGIGVDRSSSLIAGFVSSLESTQKGAFLSAIQSSGLSEAVKQFSNLQNVDIGTSLRNAIEFKRQSDAGTLDPILEAARQVNESLQELDKAFIDVSREITKTVLPALRGFNSLSPGTKTGLTVGGGLALLAGSNVLRLPGIGKGIGAGAKFAGKGLARGGRTALGLGARTLTGLKGLATRGVGAAGSGLTAASGIGLSGAAGVGLAATGVGLPAIVGAGLIRRESERAAADYRRVLESSGAGALTRVTTGSSQRDNLVRQRRRLEGILSNMRPAGTTSSLLLGQVPSGEYTKEQQRQIEKLRGSIRAIQDQVRVLDSAKMKTQAQTQAVSDSTKAVKDLSNSAKIAGNDLSDLQRRAIKLEELQLPKELQSSATALARQQKELASIGPFGELGAFNEIRNVNSSLQKEIVVLEKMLALQDESTTTGKIQANDLRTQIVGLRTEQKSSLRSLQTAFLDNALSQAIGSVGHFSKIILNQQQGLRLQLERGMVGVPDFVRRKIAGNIDPRVTPNQPIRGLDVLRMAQPQTRRKQIRVNSNQPDMKTLLKSTAKAFNKAASLIHDEDVNDVMGFDPGNNSRTLNINPGG